MIRTFLAHGHRDIDTARMYERGASEEMLGEIFGRDPALLASCDVATKANPFATHDKTLSGESVRRQVRASLAALRVSRVSLLYLHAPDPATSINETLDAVAELYAAGTFERLGLSNFQAWEVAHIHSLCVRRGDVPPPSVYQGMYNGLTRDVERELFPCLRALNMAFFAYNPLAGGLLTGKHSADTVATLREGRFRVGNDLYRNRYLHPAQLGATEAFASACKAAGVLPSHAALRWLRHHSALREAAGDAIIVGASRLTHLEDNLCALEEGALPVAILRALDDGWALIKNAGCVPSYERGTSKY